MGQMVFLWCRWCHRIFPVQATCVILKEKDLQATVLKLVLQFLDDNQNKLSRPVKFAVGYNRRGFEEKQMKIPKDNLKDSDQSALLDRNKCFSVVAAAVKEAVPDSVVDLKSPENVVSTKPRLCIRALVSDTNAKNG